MNFLYRLQTPTPSHQDAGKTRENASSTCMSRLDDWCTANCPKASSNLIAAKHKTRMHCYPSSILEEKFALMQDLRVIKTGQVPEKHFCALRSMLNRQGGIESGIYKTSEELQLSRLERESCHDSHHLLRTNQSERPFKRLPGVNEEEIGLIGYHGSKERLLVPNCTYGEVATVTSGFQGIACMPPRELRASLRRATTGLTNETAEHIPVFHHFRPHTLSLPLEPGIFRDFLGVKWPMSTQCSVRTHRRQR